MKRQSTKYKLLIKVKYKVLKLIEKCSAYCDGEIDAQVQALSSKIKVYCKILS